MTHIGNKILVPLYNILLNQNTSQADMIVDIMVSRYSEVASDFKCVIYFTFELSQSLYPPVYKMSTVKENVTVVTISKVLIVYLDRHSHPPIFKKQNDAL